MGEQTRDRHSVNCYFCGEEFDERDSLGESAVDGGSTCPDCRTPLIRNLVAGYIQYFIACETDDVAVGSTYNGYYNMLAGLDIRLSEMVDKDAIDILERAAQIAADQVPTFASGAPRERED